MKRRHWLAISLCSLTALSVGCGGGSNETQKIAADIATQTAAAGGSASDVDTKTSPKLNGPASRYTMLHEELGRAFRNEPTATFVFDTAGYAGTESFDDEKDGVEKLEDWGYQGGFEETLVPDSGAGAILNGAYNVTIESHLFEDEDGAKKAFAYFRDRVNSNKNNEPAITGAVGNEWSSSTSLVGTINNTPTKAQYDRVMYRRGNLVVVVLTKGAEGLITIDRAFQLATAIDKKALDPENLPTPTPVSQFTPATGAQLSSPTTGTAVALTPATNRP